VGRDLESRPKPVESVQRRRIGDSDIPDQLLRRRTGGQHLVQGACADGVAECARSTESGKSRRNRGSSIGRTPARHRIRHWQVGESQVRLGRRDVLGLSSPLCAGATASRHLLGWDSRQALVGSGPGLAGTASTDPAMARWREPPGQAQPASPTCAARAGHRREPPRRDRCRRC
jgi:hypothetical protein